MDRLFYPAAKEYLVKQFDGIARSIQVSEIVHMNINRLMIRMT